MNLILEQALIIINNQINRPILMGLILELVLRILQKKKIKMKVSILVDSLMLLKINNPNNNKIQEMI